jgi:hypothetical protein
MDFATESARTDHEPPQHSPESAIRETAGQESALFHGGLFSAAASNPSNGSEHSLLTHPVMRHATSSQVRAMVLRQAQLGLGNQRMQQVLIQPRRSSFVQRECACGGTCSACHEMGVEEETEFQTLQRQATSAADGGTVDADVIPSDSPGYPLDEGTRDFMESRFGTDFSDVRVHDDSRSARSAEALSANAYTAGRDIYFGAGKYAPSSSHGQRLLAHELTHTVQQPEQGPALQSVLRVSSPMDPLEDEAERASEAVVSGTVLPEISSGEGLVARDVKEQPYSTSKAMNRPTEGISADNWVLKHATNLIAKVGYELSLADPAITTPFVSWKAGQQRPFLIGLWQPFWEGRANAWSMLSETLAPDRPKKAVNSGRDCDPWDIGTEDWAEPVVGEFYKLYMKRLMESLARILPRWLNVQNQLRLRLEGGDKSADREPSKNEVFASHPLDTYVIGALPGKLDLDIKGYRAAYPEVARRRDLPSGLRPVTFEFQMKAGAWNWVRVTVPFDATTEEVAKTLYGTETKAYLLTPAPPLFGYPDINELLPVHQRKYDQEGVKPGVDPTEIPIMQEETPAHQVLAGPLADEAALLQAQRIKAAPTADPAAVIDRMRTVVRTIDNIRKGIHNLKTGQITWGIDPVRERVDKRSTRLAHAGAAEVLVWDAQSRGQLDIVSSAESGLLMAKQQQDTFQTWESVTSVIANIAGSYLRAVESSDLVETGRWWINYANEQSQLFPVTMMDLLLAELRHRTDLFRKEKTGVTSTEVHEFVYDIKALDERESKLRRDLIKVRDLVLQHPEQAKAALKPLFEEIQDLQVEVTIFVNMDQCDRAWKALYESLSFTGEIRSIWGGGNTIIRDAMHDASRLNTEWADIYFEYKYGDKKLAKDKLKQKQDSPEWRGYMQRVRQAISDQATYDKWMTFALMVGIALLTGGIGFYVETAAGAAWGAAAGWAIGTVTEAAVFTTLSYAIVAKDPSVGGFFEDFGKNLLTFGALKIISRVYRIGVGVEAAASAEGKAGEVLVQFVAMNSAALYEADREQRAKTGQGLTAAQIGEISLNNLAFLVAVAIGGKFTESWTTELGLKGEVQGNLVRIENTRTKLLDLADQVKAKKGKDPAAAREMLKKQSELLELEDNALTRLEELAKDPKAAAKAGLTQKQIEGITAKRAEFADALKQVKQARVAAQLETIGPSEFLSPKGEFFDGLKDFFKQQGHTVNDQIPPDPVTGARSIEVTPKDGTPFRVTERTSAAGEAGKPVKMLAEGELTSAAKSATERLPGETAEPLEKGEARVTEEGRCKICQSPCEYELDLVREILQEKMGTRYQGYAENLFTRVRLLDDAMQAARARGTLGKEFGSRFRGAFRKLSAEVWKAHRKFVGREEDVALPAAEEIEGFEAAKEKGIMDDPSRFRYSPERALEGTAYHEHIEGRVLRSLPQGSIYSENTVQPFFKQLGVDPKSIPARSSGIDLYVIDGPRKLIIPVDVANVAGGEAHVAKLHRDVGRLRGDVEKAGWQLSDPIEIEYVGMTFDEAAASIVSELRPFARTPAAVP